VNGIIKIISGTPVWVCGIFVLMLLLKPDYVFAHTPPIRTNTGIIYYEEARFKKDEISKPFHYIRHGQTDANKYGIAPENLDVPLNEAGVIQAKKAAKLLRERNIKIIVASPFIRTKQTAKIINQELNVPLIYHDGLKEANWGVLKGENLNKQSGNKKIWLNGGKIHEVEDLYHFQTRVHDTIKEIVNQHDNVLIVGHSVYFNNLTILLNEEYIKAKNAIPFYFTPILGNTNKELYKIGPLME
jgi:broad specificity phosphatase PhoE